MARDVTPLRRPRPPVKAAALCDDDCQRQQADALTRIADHADRLFGKPDDEEAPALKALEAIGAVATKWLSFCTFTRKWFPRVGWWLLPIGVTVLTKGSGAGADALIAALTEFLKAQTGAG